MSEQLGPVALEVQVRLHELEEAISNFTGIKAEDGDDFSKWDDRVVIRTEITVADLRALREAAEHMKSLRAWAMLAARGYDEAKAEANASR